MSTPLLLASLLALAPASQAPAPPDSAPAQPSAIPVSLDAPIATEAPVTVTATGEAQRGIVQGVVRHSTTREPIAQAEVTIACECLDTSLTLLTDARGIYNFQGLPSGDYQVSLRTGVATIHKLISLPRGAKYRANFRVNPQFESGSDIVVTGEPIDTSPRPPSVALTADDLEQLPVYLSPDPCLLLDPWPVHPTKLERAERSNPTYGLQRSLFDDAGMSELLGIPKVTRHLP